jgi:hypothetical protein
MPDMPPPVPSTTAMPAVVDATALSFDDFDYALGCECADPALQIERWAQEASGAADAN